MSIRSTVLCALSLTLGLTGAVHAKSFERMFPNQRPENLKEYNFLRGLDYKQGPVVVGEANATFTVGKGFYFLDKADANKVLVEAWGNPPDAATLGMIFPSNKTPMDYTWGAEVTFNDIGYVSDADARSMDYDALMVSMKAEQAEINIARKKEGYGTIEMIGWASAPRYDAAQRKLHWAQEMRFEGEEYNTVNYEILALGRHGVLKTNFIGDVDQLASMQRAAPKVMAMTAFEPGSRYSDFNPSVDTAAAVGIGGLIAGKALAKSGFLLALLPLLKKFGFLLIIPVLAIGRMAFQ